MRIKEPRPEVLKGSDGRRNRLPYLQAIERVAAILEDYAARGVFRGFSRGPVRNGRAHFKMLWHRDRVFELSFDATRDVLRFAVVLPEVSAGSSMYREFREFVTSRHSDELPEHRRIDRSKAEVRSGNRGGDVSLTMTVSGGDYEYATDRLITLVHEVYLEFLYDGRYYDYLIETFKLDPDHMS